MKNNLLTILTEVLQKDETFVSTDGILLKNIIRQKAENLDEKLLSILLDNEILREKFFIKIKDVIVFDINKFSSFINNKEFLPDSYTSFKNKIGLTTEKGDFIASSNEVVLNFPFKDCVLAWGQDKDKQKRDEIFYNEILSQDDIDRLFDKKIFTNFKRINKDGEHKLDGFNRDENGIIKDNLIIKWNNLLALHSLKSNFAWKVKLIYIDPPYNTWRDSFKYNDKFNHSTWLTFMKNRLEAAKDLLRDDWVIFVQISDKEVWYLNVLMDDIFWRENFINKITLSTKSPSWFKIVNLGLFETAEYILLYWKNKKKWVYNTQYEKCWYDENYNLFIENINLNYTEWNIKTIDEVLSKNLWFENIKDCKKELWLDYYLFKKADFALKNAENVCRLTRINNDAWKETLEIMEKSKNDNLIYCLNRDKLDNRYIYKWQAITFYKNKVRVLNWEKTPTTLLTNIWKDIAYEWISSEWKVTLNHWKKPEKLIQRIIEISTSPWDIVLDYHLWSGTTCAVAHKMWRQYIWIEQMDYIETISAERMKKVIEWEQWWISKNVEWKGWWDFVYMELMQENHKIIEKLEKAKNISDLQEIYENVKNNDFINYKINPENFDLKNISEEDFENFRKFLLEIIDKNLLYKNFSEINDKTNEITDKEKNLNNNFYNN